MAKVGVYNLVKGTRKVVHAESQKKLNEKILYHETKGWKPIGKVTVEHYAYHSVYKQVVEFVGCEEERTSVNGKSQSFKRSR